MPHHPLPIDPARLKPGTLQAILRRCNEVGECLEWTGPTKRGYPIMAAPGDAAVGSTQRGSVPMPVRRILWAITQGSAPAGRYLVPKCGNALCVNPDHLQALTPAQKARYSVGPVRSLKHAAHIARAMRIKRSSMTMEDVRAIRTSPETGKELAVRYGISASTVSKIRRGKTWREYDAPMGAMVDQLRRIA